MNMLSIEHKLYLKYLLSKADDSYLEFKGKKKIIVTLAADYGNLGDVAITYAQTVFLKENYPDYVIIEFPISLTISKLKSLKKVCSSEDIITIVGGGNMGDLYSDIEFLRQLIISKFPNNKIISFPQTIDFSKSEKGRNLLCRAQKVYGSHNNLILMARERFSYEKMKVLFPNNKIMLQPDIVMTLDKDIVNCDKRDGIVLCLRNDAEALLQKQDHEIIDSVVHSFGKKISFYDTHIHRGNLSINERENELQKIWNAFRGAELVITDRLHGMIFCYITGTPALVFSNNNHKIKACYSWIKESGNIIFLEDRSTNLIIDSIKTLLTGARFKSLDLYCNFKQNFMKSL